MQQNTGEWIAGQVDQTIKPLAGNSLGEEVPNHQRCGMKKMMKAQSEYVHIAHTFFFFAPTWHAQLALTNEISASELSRKFIKGPPINCWLGVPFMSPTDEWILCFSGSKEPGRLKK